MAKGNSKTLTAEQEMKLRQPIEDYVGRIQSKIDNLRADGTNRAVALQNNIDAIKRDRSIPKEEKENRIALIRQNLTKQKQSKQKIKTRFQN